MLCIKKKFKTEKDAELALAHIRRVRIKYRREKHPIRYYKCDYCKHYHLTSQPAPQEEAKLVYFQKFKEFIKNMKQTTTLEIRTPTDYVRSGHITPEIISDTIDMFIKFLSNKGVKASASQDKKYDFVYNINIEGEFLPRTIWEMFEADDTVIRDNTYSLEKGYTKGSSDAKPFISYHIDEPNHEIYHTTGLYEYEFILNDDGVFVRPSHTNYGDNQYPGRFKENFSLPVH